MSRSSFARRVRTAAAVLAAVVLFAHHPLAATDDRESENIFWQSIRESTNPADFEAYLVQYKDGTYATLARNPRAQPAGTAEGTAACRRPGPEHYRGEARAGAHLGARGRARGTRPVRLSGTVYCHRAASLAWGALRQRWMVAG
jgi:hypothetical protein